MYRFQINPRITKEVAIGCAEYHNETGSIGNKNVSKLLIRNCHTSLLLLLLYVSSKPAGAERRNGKPHPQLRTCLHA